MLLLSFPQTAPEILVQNCENENMKKNVNVQPKPSQDIALGGVYTVVYISFLTDKNDAPTIGQTSFTLP